MVFVVVFVTLVFFIPGVAMFVSAFKRSKAPKPDPVPTAQVVVHGESPIREKGRKRRALGKGVKALAAALWVGIGSMVIAVIYSFKHLDLDMTKGRLLRLRGKARLPERARGSGWSDDAVPRLDHLTAEERRVLAEAWLTSARMEHASVAAFAQLSLHLVALGAPSDLVELTHLAALDEIRHTRRSFAMASAFGGEAWTAGPIAGLERADDAPVDRVRLAVGSLVDGCVAEGIAADVAANGARGAEDPVVRAALSMIAADEARHAELAWSVLAWCLEVGGEEVRAAVAARAARLDRELSPRAPDFPGIAPDRLAAHGLFDQDTIGTLASRRIDEVRARASALLAPRLAA